MRYYNTYTQETYWPRSYRQRDYYELNITPVSTINYAPETTEVIYKFKNGDRVKYLDNNKDVCTGIITKSYKFYYQTHPTYEIENDNGVFTNIVIETKIIELINENIVELI